MKKKYQRTTAILLTRYSQPSLYDQFDNKSYIVDNEDISFLLIKVGHQLQFTINLMASTMTIFSTHKDLFGIIKANYQGGAIEMSAVCVCMGSRLKKWSCGTCLNIYVWWGGEVW